VDRFGHPTEVLIAGIGLFKAITKTFHGVGRHFRVKA